MKQPTLWAALIAFGLMSACTNGGGDGGNNGGGAPSPVTTAPTARTAAAATKAAFAAFAAGSNSSQKAGGLAGHSDRGLAIRALDILKWHISPTRLSSKVLQEPSTCIGGGTQERTTVFPENTRITTTVYHDCVSDKTNDVESYRDGSMTVTETFDPVTLEVVNVSVTFADYLDGQRNMADPKNPVRLRDDTIAGGVSASNIELKVCGNRKILTKSDANVTATLSTYLDVEGDGTADVDEAVTSNNLGIHLTQEYDTTSCDDTTMTLTANGALSAVDNLDTTHHNDFSAILTDFTLTETPATHDGVSGTEVTMNGTVSVTSDCEAGTFTFTIATKTTLFEPDSSASGCPTEGEVVVSGGGATVSVIATSTGGVQFDLGGDGTIEEEFADCNDADICRTT
ncbi:MAG: hypothetical protein HY207_06225 [Nitrospirae bacterium]|nr:hypothetical protein [Nitrospirota bacterium]